MNCIFCKIRDGEIPSKILYENEVAFAILDINPMNFGHVLVISKNHYKDILEIPKSEAADLFSAVQLISKSLTEALNLEGFNVISNKGEIAGQSIFHFHFHIIPRYKNDNINFVRSLKKYTDQEFQEVFQKINQHIKK
ncbi:MAG: HIT family protein [Bacteroidetes bacterium]|nr:HIT family protein [Bacteroidota bacterium]